MAYDLFGSGYDQKHYIKFTNGANSVDKAIIDSGPMQDILASYNLFSRENIDLYGKFNRYGYVNPFNETANREYLFFTKPDLNIFDLSFGKKYNQLTLSPALQNIPIFADAAVRYKPSLTQLQSSVNGLNDISTPFMTILTNSVSSRLDLPTISADTSESSSNMYTTAIQYRSHSLKSDNGYDFTLSFTDTKYLDIYMMVKLYDEYIRLLKAGTVSPRKTYIINSILSEQFSIYKFIVGSDGETILYFAKLTGVFFSDVPRGDFGDPGQDGFKYSLSFHSQFVEDSNPSILSDFNILTGRIGLVTNNNGETTKGVSFSVIDNTAPVYNSNLSIVNNSWVGEPYIARVYNGNNKRAAKAARNDHGNYIYLLKWRK